MAKQRKRVEKREIKNKTGNQQKRPIIDNKKRKFLQKKEIKNGNRPEICKKKENNTKRGNPEKGNQRKNRNHTDTFRESTRKYRQEKLELYF